jgi:hypothetical protein
MVHMKPYVSLGFYKPPKWSTKLVGEYITSLTKDLGLIPNQDAKHRHQYKAPWNSKSLCAYVRRRTVTNPRAEGWHQDGDLVPGALMDDSLVLWASNTPTELKVGDTVYIPKPYEIILFRNLSCQHRRPPGAPKVRWLFRQRVRNSELSP